MRFKIFVLLVIVLSGQCYAQIKVSSKKDVKFSDYKTFTIQRGQIVSLLRNGKVNEDKVFEVMKTSLSREMTMRGYTLVDDSTAQLIVTYFLQETDRSDYEKPGPLGQTPIDDPASVNEADRLIVSRTLIIQIEDNRENSLWTADCVLNNSMKDVYSLIDMTTASAFKKFKSNKK